MHITQVMGGAHLMLNTAYGTNCCHVVTGVVRVSLLSIVLIVDGVLRVFYFFDLMFYA